MIHQRKSPRFNPKRIQDQCNRKHKENLYRHLSDGELLMTSSFCRSNLKEEKPLFARIQQTGIYSDNRKETFIRFNFRTMENESTSEITHTMQNTCTKYGPFYLKTLQQKNAFKKEVSYKRGTMNVNELWSDKNLQELMGSLPFPNDRLKVLNFYKKSSTGRIKCPKKNIKISQNTTTQYLE